MKAFWFSADNNLPMHKLQKINEVEQVPAYKGLTHLYEGELVVRALGLHWAEKLIGAIYFSGGPICWEVEVGGKIALRESDYKVDDCLLPWGCAEQRTYLKKTDFLPILMSVLDTLVPQLIPVINWEKDQKRENCIQARALYEYADARTFMYEGANRQQAWYLARKCLVSLFQNGKFITGEEVEVLLQAAYRDANGK